MRQLHSWAPVLSAAALLAFSTVSPGTEPDYQYKVCVVVDVLPPGPTATEGQIAILRDKTESYLKRELRELVDVTVVSSMSDARLMLSVAVVEMTCGYSVSSTYFDVLRPDGPDSFSSLPEECRYVLLGQLSLFEGALRYRGGMNAARDANGLTDACETVVAHFDGSVLDSDRAGMEELIKAIRSLVKPKAED